MLKLIKFSVMFYIVIGISNANARTLSGKIVDMVTWSDGHTAIRIENGPQNGCTSPDYYSIGVIGQDVKAEPMLSVALAAYISGRSVNLATADGVCQGGQEKVTALRLLQ